MSTNKPLYNSRHEEPGYRVKETAGSNAEGLEYPITPKRLAAKWVS
jgi:hypothetical protein